MSEDEKSLSNDIRDWITKMVEDDCAHAYLDLRDERIRYAVSKGLQDASSYFEGLNRTLH
jgi:hypothetical protein